MVHPSSVCKPHLAPSAALCCGPHDALSESMTSSLPAEGTFSLTHCTDVCSHPCLSVVTTSQTKFALKESETSIKSSLSNIRGKMNY